MNLLNARKEISEKLLQEYVRVLKNLQGLNFPSKFLFKIESLTEKDLLDMTCNYEEL